MRTRPASRACRDAPGPARHPGSAADCFPDQAPAHLTPNVAPARRWIQQCACAPAQPSPDCVALRDSYDSSCVSYLRWLIVQLIIIVARKAVSRCMNWKSPQHRAAETGRRRASRRRAQPSPAGMSSGEARKRCASETRSLRASYTAASTHGLSCSRWSIRGGIDY